MSNPFGKMDSKDRNDQARLQEARRQIARDLDAGTINALDAFGRPLKPGMHVLWAHPHPLIWQIVSVTPVLDPKAPPGLVHVELTCGQAGFNVIANNVNRDVHATGTKQPEPPTPEVVPAAALEAGEVDPSD